MEKFYTPKSPAPGHGQENYDLILDGFAPNDATLTADQKKQLDSIGIGECSLVCGRSTQVATPDSTLLARSLMLAGLSREESLSLQQQGLGAGRKLGLGLFIPHKSIDALNFKSDLS